ncbi:hypothetical protein ASL14_18190 [Paenibacillus sp. IHB B 3084]|uniref:hypothetical protein n=1 Tax=Paenibacillus sp. IHB B 3084 TaxID=867076 RepID=UPI0007222C00|nr:hypothetical protein [Paenibacillus sp. IHB B 3084]ALP37835.1 hypothetical protein ASL14_18190 [Paenibacillus sp. IHB B 3084]
MEEYLVTFAHPNFYDKIATFIVPNFDIQMVQILEDTALTIVGAVKYVQPMYWELDEQVRMDNREDFDLYILNILDENSVEEEILLELQGPLFDK